MSYIKSILMDDEKVVYSTKPHWIIFSNSVTWLIASTLILMFGPRLGLNMIFFGYPIYVVAGFILLVFALYVGIAAFIDYSCSEFAITNRRIIMKKGLVERNSLEILLQKVESVHVVQPILGRILAFGTIVIKGVGGTQDPFPNIPDPLKFREVVQQQSENIIQTK